MPDGSQPKGLFTLILRRFDEGWKITHDHTSADDSAVASPAAPEKKAAG
jgi:ketosteroid isomerase-like protein